MRGYRDRKMLNSAMVIYADYNEYYNESGQTNTNVAKGDVLIDK